MADENQTNDAALAAAWNTPTPYGQIRTGSAFELGQYDFVMQQLTPSTDKNGLYVITMEAKCLAPAEIANLPGKASIFTRTLYVGNYKDKLASSPDTRLNNGAHRFLKKIAEALKLPTSDQSDQQMCQQLLGKQFSVALVQGKDYKDKTTGEDKKGGIELGNTVTPVGTLPAKLNRVAAAPTNANGAAAPLQGSVFA